MKVYTPIGSKERLVEMFQNVNKIKINEMFDQSNILIQSFEKLKNNQIDTSNVKTQVEGNNTFVEIDGVDENQNNLLFVFETIAEESDQDNVLEIKEVKLNQFVLKSNNDELIIEMDENELASFNSQHAEELIDLIKEYVDVESDIENQMYEEVIKKIDSYPFGGGSERFQTGKQYADEKPTNPELRVKSDELDKFVDETIEDINDVQVGDIYVENSSNIPYEIENIDLNINKASIINKKSGDKYQVSIKYLINNFNKVEEPEFSVDENQTEVEPDIEQIEKEREENGDMIQGGLGDDKSPEDFDPEQISMGIKVEMEHTNDPRIALDITIDHLSENPLYYSYLDKMEKEMNNDEENNPDEDLEDELLGFKPLNVGDNMN
jgi:hypothetical protein